jgi:hypothetical protein
MKEETKIHYKERKRKKKGEEEKGNEIKYESA